MSSRSESTANQLLAATVHQTTRNADTHGMTAYDRIGRNALAYKPSTRNVRTMRPGIIRSILQWL